MKIDQAIFRAAAAADAAKALCADIWGQNRLPDRAKCQGLRHEARRLAAAARALVKESNRKHK